MATPLKKLPVYIPLWKRAIPRYPLYWKGNPQLRLFLPLFWVRPVKAKNELPPNFVQFEIHPQMTRYDVKNYLEKIYHIPIQYVSTALFKGEIVRHSSKGFILRQEPDTRMAFVQLGEGGTFEWPDIFKDKATETDQMAKEYEKVKATTLKTYQKQWKKDDLPSWFR